MKIYTLCGSMRFEKEMRKIAYDLEVRNNWCILQCAYGESQAVPSAAELDRIKAAHLRKIDLSDGIYIVNINGYVGGSVKQEIDYARNNGKEIVYHCN